MCAKSVGYPNRKRAVALSKDGTGALLGGVQLRAAFRQLSIRKTDLECEKSTN